MGDDEQARDAAAGVASAKGFIRSHLAHELEMRITPELVFKRDLSMRHQQEMEQLLKELNIDADPPEAGS